MNKKIITKMLASMLAFILTFANVALLGMYTRETLAASLELEEQETAVSKTSVDFDAYFKENETKTHEKEIDVATNEDKLYLDIKVEEGYLTNSTITLEDSNFSFVETEEELESVQNIDTETNTITLNQINKGESVVLEIPITMNTDSDFDVENLSKITNVTLEGIYVNNEGKEISVSKTIQVSAKMTAEAEANLTAEISKYVQYSVNGEEGVVLQTEIISNVAGNVLPVYQTVIEIEIPEINGEEPASIVLSAISTKATNGNETKTFVENEDYIIEDGKIILTINNEQNEDGTISWEKDAEDQILLTCIYSEDAIVETASVKISASSEITLYDSTLTELTAVSNSKVTLEEQIGEVISYGLETSETNLYTGYMLTAGADNTAYIDTWTVNIGSRDLVDSIILENKTYYVDSSANTYTSNQNYTYTKISEENFLSILGEDGYINIYNKNGEIITTLNKDNLEYTYQTETTYIKIETSNPISEGILSIENGREIVPLEYSKAQEEMFIGMISTVSGSATLGGSTVFAGDSSAAIAFSSPSSQATLTLSDTNISTVVTKEDVEIRVTLNTTDMSTILYKNPTIEIVFPSYITGIAAENVKLLYEDELTIKSAVMYTNSDGCKVIQIELSGEQTSFNKEAQTEGATLIIQADITVDELTPTRTENIELHVTNEATGEVVEELTPVKFVAPVGMVTINQISDYNSKGDTATSISGKEEVGGIDVNAESIEAKVTMTVINNYEYNCENIVILGRTPFEGNTSITSGEDLGSTFTAKMVNEIQAVTGVTEDDIIVYYSANGDATNDLSETSNGWTTDFTSIEEVKSYMIVLNNYTLETGETLSFSYNVEIPEGLGYDESTYGIFAVYYSKQEETKSLATVSSGILLASTEAMFPYYGESVTLAETTGTSNGTEVVQSLTAGLTTGNGPDLTVTLTADVDNESEVEEGTIVTYTATITNNAATDAEEVYLTITIPSNATLITNTGTTYTGTVSFEVGTITASSSVEVEFQLKMGDYVDESSITSEANSSTVYYDENGNEYTLESVLAELIDLDNLPSLSDYDTDEDYYEYLLLVAIVSTTLTQNSFETETDYNMYLEAVEEYLASLNNEITNDVSVSVIATVEGYDDKFESNEIEVTITEAEEDPLLELSLITTKTINEILAGTIQYTLSLDARTTLTNVVIKCVIPEGLAFSSTTDDGIYDESTRTVTWTYEEFPGTDSIRLYCTVDTLPDGEYSASAPVVFTATCDNTNDTYTSNTVTLTVVAEGFTITQTSNISDGYISSGGEITYIINVTNVGATDSTVTVKDYLPEELTFVKYYYIQDGTTISNSKTSSTAPNISISLAKGESITIYLTAKADTIGADETVEVTNTIKLSSSTIDELWANEITHIIKGSNVTVDDEGNTSSGGTSGGSSSRKWNK